MAHILKLPSGLWQAQVARRGVRQAKAFKTKSEAQLWASSLEEELLSAGSGRIPLKTIGELVQRYLKEEVPHKKGSEADGYRCEELLKSPLAKVTNATLNASHLLAWQRSRLEGRKPATVLRERALLNHILTLAVREWKWLKFNHFPEVRKPKDPAPRDRIPTPKELDRLMERASPEMKRVITIAIETGMRCGEIAGLRDIRGRVGFVEDGKTGSRMVALSTKAASVLEGGPIAINAHTISVMFLRYCKELEIEDLHFHDLRRLAATNMAKRLTPMELAKQLGHSDLSMTLNTYYKQNPVEVAEKLG